MDVRSGVAVANDNAVVNSNERLRIAPPIAGPENEILRMDPPERL